MNKIFIFLRTIISYIYAAIICAIFIPPCLLIACLPAAWRYDNHLFFFLFDKMFKLILWGLFMPIKICGKENLLDEPVIFAPNHQSSLDIPVVGALCNGRPHVWLVLDFYLKFPVLGFFIKRMFVAVNQTNPAQAARSLIKIFKFVKDQHKDLIIFPEGGRYNDGTIHKFFEGFAIIAKKTGRPVIPVFIPNNGKIYPPKSFLIYYNQLVVIIGPAIKFEESDTDESFTNKVRDWFVEQNKKFE